MEINNFARHVTPSPIPALPPTRFAKPQDIIACVADLYLCPKISHSLSTARWEQRRAQRFIAVWALRRFAFGWLSAAADSRLIIGRSLLSAAMSSTGNYCKG